jgi:hypothetical protein
MDSRNIPPAHTAHSPDDDGGGPVFDSQMVLFSIGCQSSGEVSKVVLFSIIKWPYFRLTKTPKQRSGLMFSLFRCKLAWNIAPMWIHSCQSSWCIRRPLLAKFTGDLCRPSPGLHRFRENGSHQRVAADQPNRGAKRRPRGYALCLLAKALWKTQLAAEPGAVGRLDSELWEDRAK